MTISKLSRNCNAADFFFSRKGKDLEKKIEIFLENAAEIFSWRIPFML
jgi:hypothetical protein